MLWTSVSAGSMTADCPAVQSTRPLFSKVNGCLPKDQYIDARTSRANHEDDNILEPFGSLSKYWPTIILTLSSFGDKSPVCFLCLVLCRHYNSNNSFVSLLSSKELLPRGTHSTKQRHCCPKWCRSINRNKISYHSPI